MAGLIAFSSGENRLCPLLRPSDQLGGEAAIRALVQRFYELMDSLPEAYAVRQLHPESLDGSATSLFEFLSGCAAI